MSDLSDDAEQLVERTRHAFSPDARAVRELRAALERKLGAGAFGGARDDGREVAITSCTGRSAALTTHRVVAGALLATLCLGAIWLRGHASPKSIRPPSAVQVETTTSLRPSEAASAASSPAIAFSAVPSDGPAPLTAKSDTAQTRSGRRTRSERARPRAALDVERKRDLVPPPPLGAAAPNRAQAAAPSVPDDGLVREIAVLRAARTALDQGEAAKALQLLDQHEHSHPAGTLRQERLATQVLVLCSLGRVSEARSTATSLLRIAPRVPYLTRLRASCAGSIVK